MKNKKEIINQLNKFLSEEQIKTDQKLSSHTTFKIGGLVEIWTVPTSIEQVQQIINVCKNTNTNYEIFGNGSNILANDKGFDGVIIEIYKNLANIKVEENLVTAQAGALLFSIAKMSADADLTGLEFAHGIPGTLGGAVTMNAGAYDGEMKNVLETVTILNENNEIETLLAEKLCLAYRTSKVKTDGLVVLEATMKLKNGERSLILEKMKDFAGRRKDKQPLTFPSAGSTFKRPEGYFAGKLIMDSGLRGYTVGGAQVSEKHCGFVINIGGATSADVLQLITDVQRIVKEKFEVELEPEIKFLGF
ncbi:MAG: UDP-N-acetylenolpyruvoylglucosamine reductase [Epulopiscium sp. Nele67-Bin005]|nr:MAG: UDP-N-acetylenolpyruvoylglucosamine reductase [Epulopiscium sp. Nele67-Bin005]